ncbi:GntR family transcriptional regulator [Bosea sp. BK604]|uniref:GntR family transcriptional regulator n=1 Tax=Bosea sp. BK604 TaxID=2512180 RepID=UPI001045BC97|nr:GntR family transcriptional regulator [Bosea sp. BK604]TCR64286.1 GntR family transcriptional regulator [Bosea sp. BK604]
MDETPPAAGNVVAAQSGAAPRLYERAFRILAGRIAQGALVSGERLLESRVALEFGISRAPARQALAELEAAGLVRKIDGHGYAVVDAPAALASAAVPHPLAGGERLTAAPSWERIYRDAEAEIAARIAFGSWRITETELAAAYGVSRTVAREVLARLQQSGLVRKDDKSRWFAPALTPDYVAELYEMRRLLEPVALTKAMPRVPPGTIGAMRGHLDAALAQATTIDSAVLDSLEEELHVGLLGHCGNGTLMEALGRYQSLLIAHRFLYGAAPRLYEIEPFLPEHIAIVERLEIGAVVAAAELLAEHLACASERAIARIALVAGSFDPQPLPYLEPL